LRCVAFCCVICVFCLLIVLVRLSVPVQVIPHSLTHSLSDLSICADDVIQRRGYSDHFVTMCVCVCVGVCVCVYICVCGCGGGCGCVFWYNKTKTPELNDCKLGTVVGLVLDSL